ncbi:MAG: hypothetical protein SOX83_00600 [Sodaliphilus sp.]|nr:hypothetical protein [Sodaliphilus sp.]
MAKVAIKLEKHTPFGGIFIILLLMELLSASWQGCNHSVANQFFLKQNFNPGFTFERMRDFA